MGDRTYLDPIRSNECTSLYSWMFTSTPAAGLPVEESRTIDIIVENHSWRRIQSNTMACYRRLGHDKKDGMRNEDAAAWTLIMAATPTQAPPLAKYLASTGMQVITSKTFNIKNDYREENKRQSCKKPGSFPFKFTPGCFAQSWDG